MNTEQVKRRVGRPSGQTKTRYARKPGGRPSLMYNKYMSMLERCRRKSHPGYKYYGGRGVTVCDRWQGIEGYDNFVDDMGVPLPGQVLTLGRINNDKGYGPDNCRWETWKEQAQNRRPMPKRTGTIKARCESLGIDYHLVMCRVHNLSWDLEKAITTPVRHRISA